MKKLNDFIRKCTEEIEALIQKLILQKSRVEIDMVSITVDIKYSRDHKIKEKGQKARGYCYILADHMGLVTLVTPGQRDVKGKLSVAYR